MPGYSGSCVWRGVRKRRWEALEAAQERNDGSFVLGVGRKDGKNKMDL